MNLSKYVLAIMKDPATYTADVISVDSLLCQRFYSLMQRSDKDMREYGVNLEWRVPLKVKEASILYEGGLNGTAVDLNTTSASKTFPYIGDFHTHPYQYKYGTDVAIGPSNGDWVQWFATPPQQKKVAVHFVASGKELFLLIFRNTPVGSPGFSNVTSDAGRLNDLIRNDDNLAMAYGDAAQGTATRTGSGRAQALLQDWGAFRNRSGPAARVHAADTDAMNRMLANAHHHEYYRGTLQNGSAQLRLKSNRVTGNWLTSSIWSSGKSGWLG